MAESLLLLRHGEIAANRKGRWHGSTDSTLTWRGRRQVKRTARHLARRGEAPDAVYSSPLLRCQFTARAVARAFDLDYEVYDDLREYDIGEWENMRFRDLARAYDFITRSTSDPHYAPPGGESLHQVSDRIVAALRDLHQRHRGDRQILVVGHGAALAVALATLLHQNPAAWTEYHFNNCSLTDIALEPEPYVRYFNQSSHL